MTVATLIFRRLVCKSMTTGMPSTMRTSSSIPVLDVTELVDTAADLAGAFERGGRLIVAGRGRATSDARHIAVEFLHPATVGKPALPATIGRGRRAPHDRLLAVVYGTVDAKDESATDDVPDIALSDRPVPGACHVIGLTADDAMAAKEDAVVAYHVLWEMVHVFLTGEVGEPVSSNNLAGLYPMLYENQSSGPQSFGTSSSSADRRNQAIESAAQKLVETAEVRAASLTANDAQLAVGAALLLEAPTVFCFGNGGSATDAADFASVLGPKSWVLSDDVATVTALANDVGFDVVFARQLATCSRPGDVVVGFSTSGTSRNVLAGLREARQLGLRTIGFSGYDGGDMARASLDVCCVVASSSVHRIQESHVTLYNEMIRRMELLRAPARGDQFAS